MKKGDLEVYKRGSKEICPLILSKPEIVEIFKKIEDLCHKIALNYSEVKRALETRVDSPLLEGRDTQYYDDCLKTVGEIRGSLPGLEEKLSRHTSSGELGEDFRTIRRYCDDCEFMIKELQSVMGQRCDAVCTVDSPATCFGPH